MIACHRCGGVLAELIDRQDASYYIGCSCGKTRYEPGDVIDTYEPEDIGCDEYHRRVDEGLI